MRRGAVGKHTADAKVTKGTLKLPRVPGGSVNHIAVRIPSQQNVSRLHIEMATSVTVHVGQRLCNVPHGVHHCTPIHTDVNQVVRHPSIQLMEVAGVGFGSKQHSTGRHPGANTRGCPVQRHKVFTIIENARDCQLMRDVLLPVANFLESLFLVYGRIPILDENFYRQSKVRKDYAAPAKRWIPTAA